MSIIQDIIENYNSLPLPFILDKSEIIHKENSFYDIAGEYYSSAFSQPKSDDILFYLSQTESINGPILEAACGDGRILIPLAENGCSITGCDISEKMISICKQKVNNLSEDVQNRINLCLGDMCSLPFSNMFEMILLPYNSFNHLLRESQRKKCISSMFNALVKGGRLVMEVLPYHDVYDTTLRKRKKITVDDRTIKIYSKLQHSKIKNTHTVRWFYYIKKKDGCSEKIVTSFTRKDIPVEDIVELLKISGMEIRKISNNYKMNSTIGQHRLIIAEKPVN